MQAKENIFLKVRDSVSLNPLIEGVICLLEVWFEKFQLEATVTSGVRTAEHQLSIIKQKAIAHKLFPEEQLHYIGLEDRDMWEEVWSQVLRTGDIVNPPLPAKCRYEYTRAGVLMPSGRMINLSTHQMGTSFDIGGGESLESVVKVVDAAIFSATIPNLKGYLRENVNNAAHIDCAQITKDTTFTDFKGLA